MKVKSDPERILTLAISLIRAGQKEEARLLLASMLEANPRQEMAWMWLAETYSDPAERIPVMEECLKVLPESQLARKGLEQWRALMNTLVPPSRQPLPEPTWDTALHSSDQTQDKLQAEKLSSTMIDRQEVNHTPPPTLELAVQLSRTVERQPSRPLSPRAGPYPLSVFEIVLMVVLLLIVIGLGVFFLWSWLNRANDPALFLNSKIDFLFFFYS